MVNTQNRRKFPRFKVPRSFRVKARIRQMGMSASHYFTVDNLSMGGANLIFQPGITLELKRGDVLEVLMFGGNLSLRCVAKVAQAIYPELPKSGSKNPQMGVEIVGIDENSRKVLADFLERLTPSVTK